MCKILREMRKASPLLAPLFSPTMQGVLAAIVLRPEREWYLSDLASHLGVGASSLQRILAKLVQSGILTRRKNGNRVYYRAEAACPIMPELTGMLTKTVGVAEPLREALKPFAGKIRVAFIHGSVAEDRERSESDIDLIVVGEVAGVDLSSALRPLTDRLGREVNFTRFTAREFRSKVETGHHFLTAILQKPRIFLMGGEHELAEIAGRETRVRRAGKQTRA